MGLNADAANEEMHQNNASDDHISFLLKYCSRPGVPEIYNKVSNLLYKNFNMGGAELCMLCTFIACKIKEGSQDGMEN